MRPRKELSSVVKEAIRQEADRIASLAEDWQPTFENLAAVIAHAQEAEEAFIYERQDEGFERARAAGKKFGPSAIEKPKRFKEVRKRFLAGRLTADEAAEILDVNLKTFRKWCKELNQDGSSAPKRPPVKRSAAPDQRRMLAFFRATALSPQGSSVATLEEITAALRWSTDKVLQVRSDLLETERLKVVTRRNKDMLLVPGYRITKLGHRYMSSQKLARSAPKEAPTPSRNELSRIATKAAAEQDLKELPENAQKDRRVNRSTESDQRRMLAFLCATASNPKDVSTATLEDMTKGLGWSTAKLSKVRNKLLDTGKLAIVGRMDNGMCLVSGYRVTEAGRRFLDGSD